MYHKTDLVRFLSAEFLLGEFLTGEVAFHDGFKVSVLLFLGKFASCKQSGVLAYEEKRP